MKTLICILLSAVSLNARAAETNLQDATAISQPEVLKVLEADGFSLADLISRKETAGIFDNQQQAGDPDFKPVLEILKRDIEDYRKKHPGAGVGLSFDQRLFDAGYLQNPRARFVLVGVINRMDRGYKTLNRCGEIRFIYRLAYNVIDHGSPVSSRLPMTINMVFRAGTSDSEAHCADLAQSWLAVNSNSTAQDLITKGPLSPRFFARDHLTDLELNLQIVRLAASARPDYGGNAEYLLKVFHWTGALFSESTLENEIDRDLLIANPALLNDLKKWILDPQNLRTIDAGNQILPEKFLSKVGFSISPGGIERSGNRLFDWLPGFLGAQDTAGIDFEKFQNIKSPAGLIRRLNESSCIGCHQTRAIGGFHFMGKDPQGKYPGNSVFLPGSAHFMGDLLRRKDIVESIATMSEAMSETMSETTSEHVDFSRGFSDRPQIRVSGDLDGSGLLNGWSAHCSTGKDPSFKEWTCAAGLVCKTLLDTKDGLGVCIEPTQHIGDPCESGVIKNPAFGVDSYRQTSDDIKLKIPNTMCSPQSQAPGTLTGGFLNGNIRTLSCENLPPEATCGPLPASRPGFNSCVGRKNFGDCLKEYSIGVGLRGCDQKTPCRDDYICSESFDLKRGVCVPPYFLFQFRVDGHPKGDL